MGAGTRAEPEATVGRLQLSLDRSDAKNKVLTKSLGRTKRQLTSYRIPVIAATASAMPEDRRKMLEAGFRRDADQANPCCRVSAYCRNGVERGEGDALSRSARDRKAHG